ncbi:MAG: hypothetical protein ACRC6O_13435 [Flavobacterium sp.]
MKNKHTCVHGHKSKYQCNLAFLIVEMAEELEALLGVSSLGEVHEDMNNKVEALLLQLEGSKTKTEFNKLFNNSNF